MALNSMWNYSKIIHLNLFEMKNSFDETSKKHLPALGRPPGIMRDQLVNESDEALLCSICYCLMRDPKTLQCGHSFCSRCLTKCKKCALCRNVITSHEIGTNITLATLINNCLVRCISSSDQLLSSEKCTELIKAEDYAQNVKACPYIQIKCGCKKMIQRRHYFKSEINCNCNIETCNFCGRSYPQRMLAFHKETAHPWNSNGVSKYRFYAYRVRNKNSLKMDLLNPLELKDFRMDSTPGLHKNKSEKTRCCNEENQQEVEPDSSGNKKINIIFQSVSQANSSAYVIQVEPAAPVSTVVEEVLDYFKIVDDNIIFQMKSFNSRLKKHSTFEEQGIQSGDVVLLATTQSELDIS